MFVFTIVTMVLNALHLSFSMSVLYCTVLNRF